MSFIRLSALEPLRLLLVATCALCPALAMAQTTTRVTSEQAQEGEDAGPVRLRQPVRPLAAVPARVPPATEAPQGAAPGEFEKFVQGISSTTVRRLGVEVVNDAPDADTTESEVVIPPDYVVAPGDEVLALFWGSIDADLRLIVDRSGRISIPRVGAVQVGGLRYAELSDAIERRAARVFKSFQVSATLGRLRGMRVFVTGFVNRPGAHNISALSTVTGALIRAGGPSAAGTFRTIELRRANALVSRLDLYDLLLKGDRSSDRLLQAGDVIHVGPVGKQVGIVGSVNRPAIIEMLPGEVLADALSMAGGFSAVADRARVAIQRLEDRNTGLVSELSLPASTGAPLGYGDVISAFSATDSVPSTERQNKRVRIDGEVLRPGEYVLPPESTLRDGIAAAGGLAPRAFLFGTQFTRESVRVSQQQNYDRALRELETELARVGNSSVRMNNAEPVLQAQAQAAASSRLLDRLRSLRPNGRVVLNLTLSSAELPALALEDGDRLFVPPRPTTVGVFGSVFNAGSYLFGEDKRLEDYLRLAGGPTRGADESSIFVIRASGQVTSVRQGKRSNWFNSGTDLGDLGAQPGDTVFVPEELDKTTFMQAAKDWTQIISQFGLGAAAIRVLGN